MKKIMMPLALLACSLLAFGAIDTKFQEGYELQSLEINTAQREHSMSLFEGNTMMFLKGDSVYTAEIDTAATGLSKLAGSKELTNLGINGTVAYDKNKKKIYFALQESETVAWLYESTISDGKYTSPKRLVIEGLEKTRGNNGFITNAGWSYAINPKLIMTNPTIAKDGNRIYFTSADIDGGKGGSDIWYIEPKDDNMWKYPVNAGAEINTDANEDYAFVENDEIMYFASNRDTIEFNVFKSLANGDSWAAAEKMEKPYNSEVADYNLIVKDGTPFLISSRNTGNGDDIYAFVKLPEPEPVVEPEPEPEPEPVVEPEPIVIPFPWTFFLFDFDKSNLTERYIQEIDAMVEAMKLMPEGTTYVVEGHTDQRGSYEYNDILSEKRANEVKAKLVERGVDEKILIIKGYGERKPIFENPKNEEEFYQNRRVVVDTFKPENK